MADMNFGVNVLPDTTNTYTLGSADKKWIVYAQDATTSTAGLMSSSDKSKLDTLSDIEIATVAETQSYFGLT